ncbi:MAG TPA: glycine C-acetyltransferase [Bacillota bacterium]|nr:glycine C-acetyltransferase [Bacillota bacterium]HPI00918.1 glycine C-acetyltransferase [Bacillota bacterium]
MGYALDYLAKEIDKMKEQKLFRYPRVLHGRQLAKCVYDGKELVNLSSNNYLGFANHPRMIAAAEKAVRELGAGSGAVRTIAGTMEGHTELERKIAKFKHTEAALVFQSGFTANSGTVSAVLGKNDIIISDELNHASIIDGCRLSRAEIKVFRHADMQHLRERLEESKEAMAKGAHVLVITDGVFSMDGDIGKLDEMCKIAKEYGAITMVDDAHASGVLGRNGRGTVDHFNIHGQVDIQVGTLSKAIGVLGGYVAGSQTLIDYLIMRARPILFSTSHPPAVTAACLEAFDLLEQEPWHMEKLWSNTKFFKEGLNRLGFDTGMSQTPITPVMVGDGAKTMKLSDRLFEEGVFVVGLAFPTVPVGKERVRTIVTAAHTQIDLEFALDKFEKVGKELGLI